MITKYLFEPIPNSEPRILYSSRFLHISKNLPEEMTSNEQSESIYTIFYATASLFKDNVRNESVPVITNNYVVLKNLFVDINLNQPKYFAKCKYKTFGRKHNTLYNDSLIFTLCL